MKKDEYSDELKNLINQKPSWLVRYGITIIAIIAFVLALNIGFRFSSYKQHVFKTYMLK